MKINRLFEIIYLLLQREVISAKELADYFDVSPRTIYRDIETLSVSGIPIYTNRGKGGGISLLPEYVLDRTVLSEAEKENIVASLTALNQVQPEGAESIARIRSLLGSAQGDWLEIDFSSWNHGDAEARLFNQIKQAILTKHQLSCDYYNVKNEKSKRQIEPLKLCYTSLAWYVYGYCHLRHDYRFFKLKRMSEVEQLEELVSHQVLGEVLVKNKNYAAIEVTVPVILEISRRQTYRVYEEFTDYRQTESGDFRVELAWPLTNELFSYIISYGPDCKIIEPEEVKAEFSHYLEQIQNLY